MLDKAIYYKKEKRKEYRGSKWFDRSCRNHGSCSYCRDNRLYNDTKRKHTILNDLKEWRAFSYHSDKNLMGCVKAYFEI